MLGGEGGCVGRGKEDVLGREGGKERGCEFQVIELNQN